MPSSVKPLAKIKSAMAASKNNKVESSNFEPIGIPWVNGKLLSLPICMVKSAASAIGEDFFMEITTNFAPTDLAFLTKGNKVSVPPEPETNNNKSPALMAGVTTSPIMLTL